MGDFASIDRAPAIFASAPRAFTNYGFDPGALRPWLADDGGAYITVNELAANGERQPANLPVVNALLRHEEWKEIDMAVVDIARTQLVVAEDLQRLGLVQRLGGLGSIISSYEQQSDMSAASVDMAGVTAGEEDAVDFTEVGVPIPIIHKNFRINIRKLEASRRMGDSLDVTQARVATRRVRDAIEDMIVNGASALTMRDSTVTAVLRGLTDHGDRNTGTGDDWGTATNVHTNINEMIADAEADNYLGPYGIYVARTQFGQARLRHTDGSGEMAIESALRIPGVEFIKASDQLTAGEAVLVSLNGDVIDLAIAQDIVVVEWETQGGLVQHFKVMAAMAPRVKSDADGRSGIVHYTGL